MKFNDILKFSVSSLKHRKMRSWLTIIGIIIGIAAVVTLISLAEGVKESITSELSFFGADIISIHPGYTKALEEQFQPGMIPRGRIGNLTENDVRAVKTVPGVTFAAGETLEKTDVSFGSQIATIDISGIDPKAFEVFDFFSVEKGRVLVQGDSYSAIVGHTIAYHLFKNPIELGNQIKIYGRGFRVVGIYKQGSFFGALDSSVTIPKSTGEIVLETEKLSEIAVKLSSEADTEIVAEQIKNKLLSTHHLREEDQDFTVITSQSVVDTVNKITGTMAFLLGGIAAISLLVGGVGIANTMFMSVMERTREIGILKALGSTNREISKLFLIESGIIGLVGGVIGTLFGFLGTIAISGLAISSAAGFTLRATITPQLVFFSLGFSLFVGIVFGVFPARRAAKLQPVEALRYE